MMMGALLTLFALAWLQAGPTVTSQAADRATRLTRASIWTMVDSFPLGFKTHHPQGLVRIGDAFYLSSVEITTRTKPYAQPVSGYDRDTGEGTGHLFKFDKAGRLLADLRLGEGAMYHPGGIDYDGRYIWVPVAEYRPNSRAIVYRVDPATMKGTEVLRFADHIGALIHNTDERTLHGASWGSRRFYRWTLDDAGRVTNGGIAPETLRTLNPSHYLDYQDCKYAGGRRMLCTGVTEMRTAPAAPPFRLGGIDLVNLADRRPIHQVPVLLWTTGGLNMTQNPVWLEPSAGDGLRAYFVPEDDTSTVYVYEVR
jgi:hypothetical protein